MRHFEIHNNAGWYLWYEILDGKGVLVVDVSNRSHWGVSVLEFAEAILIGKENARKQIEQMESY